MDVGLVGDLLGVAIGFVGVMLMLSLVVTGIAQGLQSILRLRGRATYRALLEYRVQARPDISDAAVDEALSLAPVGGEQSLLRRLVNMAQRVILGPARRVIYLADLTAAGRRDNEQTEIAARATGEQPTESSNGAGNDSGAGNASSQAGIRAADRTTVPGDGAANGQAHLDALITDRFTLWMRWVSIVCSFVVAFCFQVSATQLLKDLSTDPALRDRALRIAKRLQERAGKAMQSFSEQSFQAVDSLRTELPDLADDLEQISGEATSWSDARQELDLALAAQPQETRDDALKRYDQLVRGIQEAQAHQAAVLREEAEGDLALLNVDFWSGGTAFYLTKDGCRWSNIIGVLLTAVLLTFGAPFWYERLRDLRVLQDALMKRREAKTAQQRAGIAQEARDTGEE